MDATLEANQQHLDDYAAAGKFLETRKPNVTLGSLVLYTGGDVIEAFLVGQKAARDELQEKLRASGILIDVASFLRQS